MPFELDADLEFYNDEDDSAFIKTLASSKEVEVTVLVNEHYFIEQRYRA